MTAIMEINKIKNIMADKRESIYALFTRETLAWNRNISIKLLIQIR